MNNHDSVKMEVSSMVWRRTPVSSAMVAVGPVASSMQLYWYNAEALVAVKCSSHPKFIPTAGGWAKLMGSELDSIIGTLAGAQSVRFAK